MKPPTTPSGLAVPTVDIEPFRSGDADARRAVAAQIALAFETIGFVTVSGHGIPLSAIHRMFDVSRAFFALTADTKMGYTPLEPGGPGYYALETESLARTLGAEAPPDIKESFAIGPPEIPDDPYFRTPDARRWFPSNQWPEIAGFADAWTAQYRAIARVAETMMQICAVGLDLPADHFAPWFDRHTSNLAVINYPEQSRRPEPGQLRAGAHSDFGSLTLLLKENGGSGLQVRAQAGDWIDVVPAPDAFIVNIGDLLAEWTNDRWVSTVHRVVNPPSDEQRGASRRMSCVYFYQPNHDAVVSPLETCVDDNNPPRYAPVTAAEHLIGKMAKQYATAADG